MFKIIRSLLGRETSADLNGSQLTLTATPAVTSPEIEAYFQREVDCSGYINNNKKQVVLDHLIGRIDILRTGNEISPEEKKALGINARLKITRELLDVLNEEGRSLSYPAAAITEMWHRATSRKTRYDNLEKMRANAVAKFKLSSCGDGNDCDWCKANQDLELPTSLNLDSEISANCKCNPYCKCFLVPVIDFGSLA